MVPIEQKAIEVQAVGVTTGLHYLSSISTGAETSKLTQTVYLDVAQCLDEEIEVKLLAKAAGSWYVYADAGVHLVSEPALAGTIAEAGVDAPTASVLVGGTDGVAIEALKVNPYGELHTTPAIPGESSSGSASVELTRALSQASETTLLIAAPGAGKRLRIFTVQMVAMAEARGRLYTSVGGSAFAVASENGPVFVTFAPYGLTLGTNEGVYYEKMAGDEAMYMIVTYTVEDS
jgi:hypothetical protein